MRTQKVEDYTVGMARQKQQQKRLITVITKIKLSNLCRPLQINSLFPVHRPHLVTASSEYSIIPYSSITFRLFLHTDGLSKSYLEIVSAHVSAVLSSQHKLHVCVIFATYKGRNKLMHALMQPFWQCQANNGLKS